MRSERYLPLEAPVINTFWPVSEKRSSDGMIGVGSRLGVASEVIEYLDIEVLMSDMEGLITI